MSENSGASRSTDKKRPVVRPYITVPLVFVLISLIVIVPVMAKGLSYSVDTVHDAQKVLTRDFNDVEVSDDAFEKAEKDKLPLDINKLGTCEKVFEIKAESIGLDCNVYFGANRVSMREGAGFYSHSSLPDEGGEIDVAGYYSTVFGSISELKKGEVITLVSPQGDFRYLVSEIKTASEPGYDYSDEYLVLSTSADGKAFSSDNNKRLFVIAKRIIGEVQ